MFRATASLSRSLNCLRPVPVHGSVQRSLSSAPAETIGFIGLGQMGSRMAANLLKHNRAVCVFDVSPEALSQAQQQGASVASSPAELASRSKTILTMLPSSPHVESVYADENTGVFGHMHADSLLIDCSTVDIDVSRSLAKRAFALGSHFLDAPVSGGTKGAQEGTLTFMCGGEEKTFERAEPVLSLMGGKVARCGDNGSGLAAKLANNLALGIQMIGIAEAFHLGVSQGVDPKALNAILNASTAGCWSSRVNNPVPGVLETSPASNNYQGGFASMLMRKDLNLALNAGKDLPLTLGATALQFYNLLTSHGYGAKDFGVIYEFLTKKQ